MTRKKKEARAGNQAAGEFRRYLSVLAPVPDSEWALCRPRLLIERFAPRELIQDAGSVCNRILFLASGRARTFMCNASGREFTWALHFDDPTARVENRFMQDCVSFTQGSPSAFFIEALTEVETVSICRPDHEHLQKNSSFWNESGRRLTELGHSHTQRRLLSLLSLSAKDRYLELANLSPVMMEAAPQHVIASYLGITPQSLSRIRREFSKSVTKSE